MKALSCGVIVTNGEQLLSIVPWGKKSRRDVPKGHLEGSESPEETAIREVYEETNLIIRPKDLISLGRFSYTEEKDLFLFLFYVDELPPIGPMKCNSYFTNVFGQTVPESVGFEYLPFTDPSFYPKLQPILSSIYKELHSIKK